MKVYSIANEELVVKASTHGAELQSIQTADSKTEYMWQADPAYWKRCAPVLFPNVGSLKNKAYVYQNETYPMGQHGFARDTEFVLLSCEDHSMWFRLAADDATKKLYPFDFCLDIGYTLSGKTLTVTWRVKNCDHQTMYFSIGAHPAFNCPHAAGLNPYDYRFRFETDKNEVTYQKISGDGSGLAVEEWLTLPLEDGCLAYTEHLFDEDALIIDSEDISGVSLVAPDGESVVTMHFDTPLVGLWSPAGKHAPFVCIEPWYGRCDGVEFSGEIKDRKYIQQLHTNETFEKSYTIEL